MKKADRPAGGSYKADIMESLVKPPKRIPWILRWMVKIADIKAGKKMLTGRVLSWSRRISVSSGLLELFVEGGAAAFLDRRLIKLLRIIISYTVPSPFTVDINSVNYKKFGITEDEITALLGEKELKDIPSFSEKERAALEYAKAISKTPVILQQRVLDNLRSNFSEREIVAIAGLSAKVNYWARLIEGLRIKPAGYTNDPALHLDEYTTLGE